MGLLKRLWRRHQLEKCTRALKAKWGVTNFERQIAYANSFFKAAVREEYQSMFLYEWGSKETFIEWAAQKGRELTEEPGPFDYKGE